MASITQDNRYIAVATPLGKDKLLLEGFSGAEQISGLFHFDLDLLALSTTTVEFDKLLGQGATVTVSLGKDKKRYLHGIINQVRQGHEFSIAKDKESGRLIRYRAELVPAFWLLTKIVQSRIFQHLNVPDILKKVLVGPSSLTVTYQLKGKYDLRDYVAQYRESDYQFASRLMEEEGIFYYFKHSDGKHEMVVSDNFAGQPDVEVGPTKIPFDEVGGDVKTPERIHVWEKSQELGAGKVTLWDYCFELPDKHLEASQDAPTSATVGTVEHKIKIGANEKLELYDFPGGYAQRYDGINKGGTDQTDANSKPSKIFDDNKRTVKLRMEQEAALGVIVTGEGDCRHFVAGSKFTLERHFNANGSYVLTQVKHKASIKGAYTTGGARADLAYSNSFQCVPANVAFRPRRETPRPVIQGTQTAVVVGPDGQEIFTDKYGRVKVQFFWDRDGKKNADSSCWLRVGTPWAGKNWGMIHLPRIGQEVIVAFLEGDPDQPIVVGSVYNFENMPPYTLPDNMTQSGLKTRSTLKGDATNFNELRFEDKKGKEEVYFHAEKDFNRVVENNDTLKVGSDKADDGSQTIDIYKNRTTTIQTGDETFTLKKGKRTETLSEGDESVTLAKGKRTHAIKSDDTLTVEGKQTVTVTGDQSVEVKQGNHQLKVTAGTSTIDVCKTIELKVGANSIKIDSAGKITVTAAQTIELTVGGNSIKIATDGITINGAKIGISASGPLTETGNPIQIN